MAKILIKLPPVLGALVSGCPTVDTTAPWNLILSDADHTQHHWMSMPFQKNEHPQKV